MISFVKPFIAKLIFLQSPGDPLEAARDVASTIPVRGGGTRWGEPDDWFPGCGELEAYPEPKPERGNSQNRERSQ
jgi:hypothetical protein